LFIYAVKYIFASKLNIHFDAKNIFKMEISEIIKSLSILTVLEHYGIKMNRNKMVSCPFHDDTKPLMVEVYVVVLPWLCDRFPALFYEKK